MNNFLYQVAAWLIKISCFAGLAGCSGAFHKISEVGSVSTLSIDARQRVILSTDSGGENQAQRIVCAEPSPDTMVARAAALSSSINTPQGVQAAFAASSSEAAAAIGLRTETVQILRDGYFRLCEGYMNGALDEDDYSNALTYIDGVIATVLAIDTLGGQVVSPKASAVPAVLNPADVAPANNGGKAVESVQSGASTQTVVVETAAINSDQADAIQAIVKEYLHIIATRQKALLALEKEKARLAGYRL